MFFPFSFVALLFGYFRLVEIEVFYRIFDCRYNLAVRLIGNGVNLGRVNGLNGYVAFQRVIAPFARIKSLFGYRGFL